MIQIILGQHKKIKNSMQSLILLKLLTSCIICKRYANVRAEHLFFYAFFFLCFFTQDFLMQYLKICIKNVWMETWLVRAPLFFLLLRNRASISELSWSDLSPEMRQLSALKDFLKERTESHAGWVSSVLVYAHFSLSLFPPQISWHWHTLQVQATAVFCCILTQVSRSLLLHHFLELYISHNLLVLKLRCRPSPSALKNRLHTVTLCSRILWDPINDSERLDGRLRSGKSDTHTKSPMLIWLCGLCRRAWVSFAGFGRELMWASVKLRGKSKDKQLSPIALWDTSVTCPPVLPCSGFVCVCVKL